MKFNQVFRILFQNLRSNQTLIVLVFLYFFLSHLQCKQYHNRLSNVHWVKKQRYVNLSFSVHNYTFSKQLKLINLCFVMELSPNKAWNVTSRLIYSSLADCELCLTRKNPSFAILTISFFCPYWVSWFYFPSLVYCRVPPLTFGVWNLSSLRQ